MACAQYSAPPRKNQGRRHAEYLPQLVGLNWIAGVATGPRLNPRLMVAREALGPLSQGVKPALILSLIH